MRILLVEDHQEIAGIVFDYFELKGYELDHAANGEFGLKLGLSKSWTSRLHARVIEKLHRMLEDSLS